MDKLYENALRFASSPNSEKTGIALMKIAIAIIFLWIGWLKFQPYEADSITVFVANSPLLSILPFWVELAYKSCRRSIGPTSLQTLNLF